MSPWSGKHLVLLAGQALHGAVQHVDVGDLQAGVRQGVPVHGVGVVLAGDLQLAGEEKRHA